MSELQQQAIHLIRGLSDDNIRFYRDYPKADATGNIRCG